MNQELDIFLAAYSRESREISLCLRKLIHDFIPAGYEKIEDKNGLITYSLPHKSDSWTFAIAPHMKHVNLIFSKGAKISDSSGLLAGSGKFARHIRIRSENETENPNLRKLLEEAVNVA